MAGVRIPGASGSRALLHRIGLLQNMSSERTDHDSANTSPQNSGEPVSAARTDRPVLTVGDRQYSSREERLQAIQKAVQAGDYDSDEILEVAVARMLRRGAFEDE